MTIGLIAILIAFGILFFAIRSPERMRGPSYYFSSRYKRYAAWPVVLWCRFRSHEGQGAFSDDGTFGRCTRCGDRYSTDVDGVHPAAQRRG